MELLGSENSSMTHLVFDTG